MLVHALLSLLVFEHGFIQIRFGIFEFFCFCFISNKYFLILLHFTSFLCKHNFFIDEKRTQWMLNTKVKVFHESISCFMKWPWKKNFAVYPSLYSYAYFNINVCYLNFSGYKFQYHLWRAKALFNTKFKNNTNLKKNNTKLRK